MTMHFGDIDFPDPLIEAHEKGRLVFFVGAGASMSRPSSLPNFRNLARKIATESGHPPRHDPAMLLGTLAKNHGVDVHLRVRDCIADEHSKPNSLHRSIIHLAASTASAPVRIVTTNYDLHLSTVASAKGLDLQEFLAPALPMGDDFTGLVYLHGSVRQEPCHLVVTDADFGRAYLRDAWAVRFLERMFTTYAVLFIGYSHSDVVMSYLATSLRADCERFALTDDPEGKNWDRLGIRPVGYPRSGRSHAALKEGIAAWASWASMGLLDHRQRVARLTEGSPSQVPEEMSYLESVVAHEDTVECFTEQARGAEWLAWASAQPEFRRLFDQYAAPTGCTPPLADWFVGHFVLQEDLTDLALSALQRAGGRTSFTLRHALGRLLHGRNEPRPAWLRPWITVLLQQAPDDDAGDWLEYALLASRWPEDRDTALMLFDHLTEPRAEVAASLSRVPRIEVRLRGNDYWLREAWATIFLPNLGAAAHDVLSIADHHLRHAYRLLPGAGMDGFDSLPFARAAIEPHEQDRLGQPVDILVDAARDSLEAVLTGGGPAGPAYLDAWESSDLPLLRRLAVHGWTHRQDVDAAAKLSKLRDAGWLFDHRLRHEVFGLIATAVRDAPAAVADGLVGDVLAWPGEYDDDDRTYEILNALSWITRHAPELESASAALNEVEQQHPEFTPREHPSLLAWPTIGFVSRRPPMSVEELHSLIAGDAAKAVRELRKFEGREFPFEGPTWEDATELLAETVKTHPQDGFPIIESVAADNLDLLRAALRGWGSATLDCADANAIAERLLKMNLREIAQDVANMLVHHPSADSDAIVWYAVPSARKLASAAWSALPDDPVEPFSGRWLERAINHPAGYLAEFWILAVAADWRVAGDDWRGLPDALRVELEHMLAGDDDRTALAEVVFASRLHFFFSADRSWCEQRILPLLDWAHPERARRTWDGFLTSGRPNDQLLTAGLLDGYLSTAEHIEEFHERLRRQYCHHLAYVTLNSAVDPIASGLTQKISSRSSTSLRVAWMDEVASMVARLPVDAAEHQWARWMRRYWEDRLASMPTRLTVDEASAMAVWVIGLDKSMAEGVSLAREHDAGIPEHSSLLLELNGDRIARAPSAIARLVLHLLRGTQRPFHACHSLHDVVRALRNHSGNVDDSDLEGIAEQALRLRCSDAANW